MAANSSAGPGIVSQHNASYERVHKAADRKHRGSTLDWRSMRGLAHRLLQGTRAPQEPRGQRTSHGETSSPQILATGGGRRAAGHAAVGVGAIALRAYINECEH